MPKLLMSTINKIINGEKKCYALKDKKLQRKAKGIIELEMFLTYNTVSKNISLLVS